MSKDLSSKKSPVQIEPGNNQREQDIVMGCPGDDNLDQNASMGLLDVDGYESDGDWKPKQLKGFSSRLMNISEYRPERGETALINLPEMTNEVVEEEIEVSDDQDYLQVFDFDTGKEINLDKIGKDKDYIKPTKIRKKNDTQAFEKRLAEGNRNLLNYLLNKSEEEVEDYILDRISNIYEIGSKFESGKTFLHYAVARGNKRIMEALIEAGASLEVDDDFGRTALIEAVILGRFVLFQVLIQKKADIYHTDNDGRTALHFASICSNFSFYFLIILINFQIGRK